MNCQSFKSLFILVFALLSFSNLTLAQKVVQIKGAVGIGEIAGRISYEEASRDALNQAKIEALKKAGVSEHLQSYENLYRSEVNNDYSEFFSSDIQSELQGAVQSYQIVKKERKIDPLTQLFNVEITIDASVILYDTKPDPTFNIRVDGIKGIYEEGEELKFSVYSTQNCYLHIFAITDNVTSLMYPNTYEPFKEIQANKTISFPFSRILDYALYKTTKGPEMNRILFVFTKEPIRFLAYQSITTEGFEEWIATPEDIFSWVYGLKPDIRKVDYHIFTVR
jgi:hypothetical protein